MSEPKVSTSWRRCLAAKRFPEVLSLLPNLSAEVCPLGVYRSSSAENNNTNRATEPKQSRSWAEIKPWEAERDHRLKIKMDDMTAPWKWSQKHLDLPLLAGCSTGHKPWLLNDNGRKWRRVVHLYLVYDRNQSKTMILWGSVTIDVFRHELWKMFPENIRNNFLGHLCSHIQWLWKSSGLQIRWRWKKLLTSQPFNPLLGYWLETL